MRNLGAWLVLLISGIAAAQLCGQGARPATESPLPAAKKSEQKATDKQEKAGVNKLLAPNPRGSTEPTTTEIYEDEAFVESKKNTRIFTRHGSVAVTHVNVRSA